MAHSEHHPPDGPSEEQTSPLSQVLPRRRFITMAGAGVALAAASRSSALRSLTSDAARGPAHGGTLKVALTGDPDVLDPTHANLYTSWQILDDIFNKLVDLDVNGNIIPELATSWVQKSPTMWVFNLVPNATFHNGVPFTANDVKFTFDRILAPATHNNYTGNFNEIDGVEVLSPHSVAFHLKYPFGPFLTNLAQQADIVNQAAVEASDALRHPIGTGPFQFVNWVQDASITVKRNPHYFQAGKPYLDEVVYNFLPVDQSRIEGLQSGTLDWVDAVPLQELPSLQSNSSYRYVTSDKAGFPDFIALNTAAPPFNNKALRQAVAWAVDLKEILDIAYFGAGQIGSQEVGDKSQWYGGKNPYQSGPNLAKARQKLKEAGYENGLTVTYLAEPAYPELLKIAELVQSQLSAINIKVNVQQLETSVWIDKYVTSDFQMTSAYWSGMVDPDNFWSNILKGGTPSNFTKYNNPTVNSLIQQAKTATDVATRRALYTRIREIVWDDVPLIFAHFETTNYLMNNKVYGSTVNPCLELRLGQVWMS
jgi:peptide/nickel transport system substrate-binding protein